MKPALREAVCALLLTIFLSGSAPAREADLEVSRFVADFVASMKSVTRARELLDKAPPDEAGGADRQMVLEEIRKADDRMEPYSRSMNISIRNNARGIHLALDVIARSVEELPQLQKRIEDAVPEESAGLRELKEKWSSHAAQAWELLEESATGVSRILAGYQPEESGEPTLSAEERDNLIREMEALFPDL